MPRNTYKTIGELTGKYGFTARTLRFWEQRRLITPKREGNRRLYSWYDECQVRRILLAQRCGLSLDEAAEVLCIEDRQQRKAHFRTLCHRHLDRLRREAEEATARRARVSAIVRKIE